MKKFLKRLNCIIAALALTACAASFCGFEKKLSRGVFVNGTYVGGLTISAAKQKLRRAESASLLKKRLHICANERVFTFTYPEINFTDNFNFELGRITSRGEYEIPVCYYLCAADEAVNYIASSAEVAPRDAYCTFNLSGEPFSYYAGTCGVFCDRQALAADISSALNGGKDDMYVEARTSCLPPTLTVKEIKENTQKLASYTTYFDGANVGRAANIRLAASKLNGVVLPAGGEFSFNKTVGERTEENGFKRAKIISDGAYKEGVGGGVCQVSTTLYNAAALCGLKITEYHPHSLLVSYVPPSRDAMVSGDYFDLKFLNVGSTDIYIRASAGQNYINCTLYGKNDGYSYEFVSEVSGSIPYPSEGETYGRDGTLSFGELYRIKGEMRERVFLREDKYLPFSGKTA